MLKDDDSAREVLIPEDIPMPFAELSPEGRVLSCNRKLRELAGVAPESPGEVPPQPGLIPPEWRPGRAGPEGGAGLKHFSTELATGNGSTVKVEAFARRIDDARGRPCRFLVTLIDRATVRSMEEAELVRVEQRASQVASLLDEVQSPVFATDDQSRIVYANAMALRLFGMQGRDVTGMYLWDAYPISHTDLFYRIYQRSVYEHRTLSADHYAPRLNVWYESRFYPLSDGGMVVVMNNVTARKQYERFMGLAAYTVNQLSDYIFWLDARGRITKANDHANRNLRFPENPKALVSLSTVTDISPAAWDEIWKEVKSKGPETLKVTLIRRNGDAIPTEALVSYVLYVGQEYGVLIARDISDRLLAEREITRSREQAELYLDLMSHDIRNINQIGAGFIELVLGNPALSESDRDMLEKPLEAFQRSTDLISNVKKLQKTKGSLALEETDLVSMLRNVVAQNSNVKERDISIDLLVEDDCRVMANPLLKEVFSNLVSNAIKHSRGRINIWITLRKVAVPGRRGCEVIVEDDGPGIPGDMKPRLFSVKKLIETGGRRRGLGLILAKSLLDDFGGTIKVEDRVPGDHTKGARFVVTLPAA